MAEKWDSSRNEIPLFDETYYFAWREKMKEFLKWFGVWETVINVYFPSKKQSKVVAKKEARKNNSTTLKFILDGLPSSIKKSVGEYTSARDPWSMLGKEYQRKWQDTEKSVEEKPIEDIKHEVMQDSIINEGDNRMESFDCCSPKSDDAT